MIIISAMSKDKFIGSGDGMPWNVPEEYAQFLRFVDGQAVVMGRKSFEIFGQDMKTTENFVITRSADGIEGATVCGSIEEAVEKAVATGKTVFSAGGGSIYDQTIPLADTMYLSFIKGDFTGDTKFPEFDENEWDVEKREDHAGFEFVVYKRK
ncbi:MAG: dihydrofolate reductase [Candidatus Latescibacteria bacterium]|jgi:dihydrofolate reductase|nr:dihydrofolate reductase [Candidatus Latescibacterota bacterium]MBT5832681.1 dihydrofolate reductase [Candidatus Latescibacterota bacterium]